MTDIEALNGECGIRHFFNVRHRRLNPGEYRYKHPSMISLALPDSSMARRVLSVPTDSDMRQSPFRLSASARKSWQILTAANKAASIYQK